ncbi:type II toxin-antitoxin system RelE/ParE family toxin [Rhizobium sp. 1AS11]|uniref:type II toxin-antitoxin system RelE/ParE family toxin n=1 Tax=Rhizobium acaciae TaxID=2989736 RepID=UPI002222CCE1|nr:type II toxin-antitoxin system RelE/ParE family toxin [Rhizobium acaciae]MCW1413033.1 type II toxin-antitoxin system RelE/ParE family toxin [Rhizobium acaciae]MCW1745185.1 type II toxin-antitoxin system RelE/ParE family toxin [Rhizobium acaciae]
MAASMDCKEKACPHEPFLVHLVMKKAVDRPKKTIVAEFYQTPRGKEPVREWLKALTLDERQAIAVEVRTAEYGWPLGMPTCDGLGDGLWEVRITLKDKIARVFFYMEGSRMILLHGIIKKDQVPPKVDVDTARDRKRESERRLEQLKKKKEREK